MDHFCSLIAWAHVLTLNSIYLRAKDGKNVSFESSAQGRAYFISRKCMHLADNGLVSVRETAFVTACLLSCTSHFWKDPYLKKESMNNFHGVVFPEGLSIPLECHPSGHTTLKQRRYSMLIQRPGTQHWNNVNSMHLYTMLNQCRFNVDPTSPETSDQRRICVVSTLKQRRFNVVLKSQETLDQRLIDVVSKFCFN